MNVDHKLECSKNNVYRITCESDDVWRESNGMTRKRKINNLRERNWCMSWDKSFMIKLWDVVETRTG
jgi:hypothetical protein